MSGYTDEADAGTPPGERRALLKKPFTADSLLRRVREMMAEAA
jgi:hypothetical protein